MPEEGKGFLEGEQTGISPGMEADILELLAGDLKDTALGFVAYLREHGMTPRQWFPNYWRVPYGKNYLCCIIVNKDRWRVFFFSGDYRGEFDEGFVEAVQDSVTPCVSCVDDCPKGKDMVVFGREFPNTCFQFPVQFVNPDGSALEHIKELIEYWKKIAPHSDSWHAH